MLSFSPDQELEQIKAEGLYRQYKTIQSAQGPTVRLNGQEYINFCSNDYLGLANDPRLIAALKKAAERFGVGSGASQLVCGRSSAHRKLEESLAEFTGRDRAIILSSGYMANLAIISTLAAARGDLVIEDKLNHASAIDGAILSRAKFKRYGHNDIDSLKKLLLSQQHNKLVFTEAVFSMDGDVALLAEIASACSAAGAFLVVDDAHGFGVLGRKGGGSLEEAGLTQKEVPLMMATFGKALGSSGAFVAGSEKIIELLIQKARPLIFSTALPPAIAETNREALKIVAADVERRNKLQQLIKRFKQGAKQLSLPLKNSDTAVQPLIIGSAKRAVELSERLLQKGILISAIRPPTVPPNTSRLRITLSAAHSEKQIDCLLECLSSAIQPVGGTT